MVDYQKNTVLLDSENPQGKYSRRGPGPLWILAILTCALALPIREGRTERVAAKASARSPNRIPTFTNVGSGLVAGTSRLRGSQAIRAVGTTDLSRREMVVTPLPPGSSESTLSPPPFQLPNGPVSTTVTSATPSKAAVAKANSAGSSTALAQQANKPLLDRIRYEIKQRLYVFQNCAVNARRRGVECRRVDATWNIGADGTIKSIVFTNVPDPLFALCLQRIENQPLVVKPGMELKIPTPIVFVR